MVSASGDSGEHFEWRLYLLGAYHLALEGERPVGGEFESNKVRALLAYLVVEGEKRHSRDTLASLLWPDVLDTVARKNLRQALSNLRKVLGDTRAETPHVLVDRHTVWLNPERPIWSDVGEFITLMGTVERHRHRDLERCPACAYRLQRAVNLYRDEFLSGFAVGQSAPFDDWMVLTRERLHQQAVRALEVLVRHYELAGQIEKAQQCAEHLVRLDPWREEVYVNLMRLLAARGQRSAALRVFQQCQRVLCEEFGVEPAPATKALVRRIQAGETAFEVPELPPATLPPEFTPFVGRRHEVLELSDYLVHPETRLLTITGPGGVGKTRLAVQVGKFVRVSFADGVVFVPLAGTEGEHAAVVAIADALKVPLRHAENPLEELVRALADRQLLLILDNFDHLLETREDVAAILQHTEGVVLLVTSRRPLGLQAERVYTLGGLPYPSSANGELHPRTPDAVHLFVERAQRVMPAFRYEGETRQHVDFICRLAEGLPLAIELAAASVRRLSCAHLAEQMAQGLDVLRAEWADVSPHHRSIRSAFEYSWRLLSPEEQTAFARLSVFRGAFSAEAANRVAGATESVLGELVAASLVTPEGEAYYRLHELLRQFGAEKLGAARPEIQNRLAAHYASFLEAQRPLVKTAQQVAAFDRIAREFDNVRAAWLWAVEAFRLEDLQRMMQPLYLFLEGQSRYLEGLTLFRRAVERLEEDEEAVPPPILWGVRLRLAVFRYRTGDYGGAEAALQACCRAFQDLGALDEELFAWQTLGNIAHLRADYATSERALQRALELAYRLEDGHAVSTALNTQGLNALMSGEYTRALELLDESLAVLNGGGDPWSTAVRLANRGIALRYLGRYDEAKRTFAEALSLWRQLNSLYGEALCYNNLGLVAVDEKRWEEAAAFYRQCVDASEKLGSPEGVAAGLNNLGKVMVELGNFREAQKCFQRARAIRERLGDRRGLLSIVSNEGELARRQGQPRVAWERWFHVLREAPKHGVPTLALDSLYGLASLLAEAGRFQEAATVLYFVVGHAAAAQVTRTWAQQKLDEVVPHLAPPAHEQARHQARALTLEEISSLLTTVRPDV